MTARRCAPGAALAAYLIAGGLVAGTRDPFAPPVAGSLGADGTPLQRIELSRLRLVAVVSDTRVARALLEDETGLGYIATVGTPVGRRGGVVVGMGRGWLRILEPGEGPRDAPDTPDTHEVNGEPEQSAIVLEMSSMAERR